MMKKMYNKDLFEKLRQEFGDECMPKFCEMVSRMYDILYKDWVDSYHTHNYQASVIEDVEYNYERDWWGEKAEELIDGYVGYTSQGTEFKGVRLTLEDGSNVYIPSKEEDE
jgi:hypothetical protein